MRACWEEGRRATAEPALAPLDANEPMDADRGLAAGGRVGAPTRPGATERRTWTAVRAGGGGPLDRPDPMRLRGFIPIEELEAPSAAPQTSEPPTRRGSRRQPREVAAPQVRHADRPIPVDDWETRVSLFGEADL
jgi:hypothetical protein